METLLQGFAIERNFVETVVGDDELQQSGVIFRAARAEGYQHRASL
jgi:hypothetical protein